MNKTEIKILNNIIQINLDSSKIYRIAAENSSDPKIQTFFDQAAINREEIMQKAMDMSGQSETDPSLKAELQQFWINLKTAKKKFNEKPLIDECIKEEKLVKEKYEDLEDTGDISEKIKDFIAEQKKEIDSNIDQLKNRRDEFKSIDDDKNRETPV